MLNSLALSMFFFTQDDRLILHSNERFAASEKEPKLKMKEADSICLEQWQATPRYVKRNNSFKDLWIETEAKFRMRGVTITKEILRSLNYVGGSYRRVPLLPFSFFFIYVP